MDMQTRSQLLSLGYVPEYSVRSDHGLYVKCTSPAGHRVYISCSSEPIPTDTESLDVVPAEFKSMCLNCNTLEIPGVAFESANCVCFARRTIDYTEWSMSVANLDSTTGLVHTYPILLLDEIRTHPDLCIQISNLAFKRMRNAQYQADLSRFQETTHRLDALCRAIQETTVCMADVPNAIMADITQLEDILNEYSKICNKTPEQLEGQRLSVYNLGLRHKYLEEYLGAIHLLNSKSSLVSELCTQIQELNSRITASKSNLGVVLQPQE